MAFAPAASAHTVGGVGATNFQTTVGPVTPPAAGLSIEVIENGSRLALTNTTGHDVVVLGYSDEPYLRVGPRGVFTNHLSTATYYNADRQGTTPIPKIDGLDSGRTDWRQVDRGQVARWHDHRIHYMSTDLPPLVRAQPGVRHLVADWTVTFDDAGTPRTASGQLTWVPGPSPWPWWALAAALLLAVASVPALPRWRPVAIAAVALAVVSDAWHSVAIALVKGGTGAARWSALWRGSWVDALAWVTGLVAVTLLLRRRLVSGLFLAAATGAVVGIVGGLGDVSVLSRSSAPFAGPLWLGRALTAASIGLGGGLVLLAVTGLRRHDRQAQPASSAAASQPSSSSPLSASS